MKFTDYVLFKEADASKEIEAIFNQTSADIDKLFTQLYTGTANMVKSSGGSMPDALQNSIMDDLKRIAQKIGANKTKKPNVTTDPRAISTENVMADTFIKDIIENLSVVNGLGRAGKGGENRDTYDFKSVLTNAKSMIMDRMAQLKSTVLRSISMVGDIHGKVGDIHGATVMAMSPKERESAEDALKTMGNLISSRTLKLFTGVDAAGKPTGPIKYDPADVAGIQQTLAKINPKKVYAYYGGRVVLLDLTNRQTWTNIHTDAQPGVPAYQGPPEGDSVKMAVKPRARKDGTPLIGVNNNPRMGG